MQLATCQSCFYRFASYRKREQIQPNIGSDFRVSRHRLPSTLHSCSSPVINVFPGSKLSVTGQLGLDNQSATFLSLHEL